MLFHLHILCFITIGGKCYLNESNLIKVLIYGKSSIITDLIYKKFDSIKKSF